MNKNFQEKIKQYIHGLSKKVMITIILTLLLAGYFAVKAAFIEPSATPANSDQDFAENILGANNNNNDFDSSNVASNRDGSIIERLEFIVGGATCGNSLLEIGEKCDDGGTSWTSGACAGDCSRRNYWSSPSYANFNIGGGTFYETENAYAYCQERGFRVFTSFATTTGSGLANYRFLFNSSIVTTQTSSSTNPNRRSYTVARSEWIAGWNLSNSYSTIIYSQSCSSYCTDYYSTIFYYTQPSTSVIISEIWCAD